MTQEILENSETKKLTRDTTFIIDVTYNIYHFLCFNFCM